jgi:hypothetical protein
VNEQERIARAERVKEVIESEWFIDAIRNMDRHYVSAWRNAKTVEAREDAHRYAMLLDKFAKDLRTVVMDGAFAVERVKELEGQKGGLRKIFG